MGKSDGQSGRAFLLSPNLAHPRFDEVRYITESNLVGKHRVVSAQFAQMVPLSQSSTHVLA